MSEVHVGNRTYERLGNYRFFGTSERRETVKGRNYTLIGYYKYDMYSTGFQKLPDRDVYKLLRRDENGNKLEKVYELQSNYFSSGIRERVRELDKELFPEDYTVKVKKPWYKRLLNI